MPTKTFKLLCMQAIVVSSCFSLQVGYGVNLGCWIEVGQELSQ